MRYPYKEFYDLLDHPNTRCINVFGKRSKFENNNKNLHKPTKRLNSPIKKLQQKIFLK